MATLIKILPPENIKLFDNPPELSGDQRKQLFFIHKWVSKLIGSYSSSTNMIGFILQLGYFRAVNKFYNIKKSHEKDIEYIARKLRIRIKLIDLNKYAYTTAERHREIILHEMGFKKFDSYFKEHLKIEAQQLTATQIKPRLIFMSLIDYLSTNKVQIPSYNTLARIITQSLKTFEKDLVCTIQKSLTEKEIRLIDELLEKENSESKTGSYSLTAIKKHNHSVKAGKIKENIADYEYLETLFTTVFFIIKKINLSPKIIKYYAETVIRSQVFQINRRDENKYLYLIAFIVNGFYELNDMLVLKVNKIVQQSKNSGEKEKKELIFEKAISGAEIMKKVASGLTSQKNTLASIRKIMFNSSYSPEYKIESVIEILKKDEKSDKKIDNDLNLINDEISRSVYNADYYDSLEAKSLKLQNKISGIIKHVTFDEDYSNKDLINTIAYFKEKDGRIRKNAPLTIFDDKEQKILFNKEGKIRISLYKILLFIKISHGIKSGTLNLLHSYEYKAFAHYLIPISKWEANRKKYIERAGLTKFKSWNNVKDNLKKLVETQYKVTNDNIENQVNEYIKINEEGKITLKKYKPEFISDDAVELFPQNKYISIYEVISTVDDMTGFIDLFEHVGHKYGRYLSDQATIIAGILGYGCNIGIHKIAKLSKEINSNKLNNVVKMRFLLDNVYNANNKVLSLIDKFEVSKLFKKHPNKTHTASDGQKFLSTVDSVYANKSFKYFGMNDGLVINSFIDDRNRLFYSTVISPAEREAPYTIDGLLHNEVVQSDIHSTDTHGYNEIIFAVTHLLGISFAPRIANFKRQYLYSFDPVSDIKKLGYKIVPNTKINVKLIEDNWDDILRFIATIKTKEVTASQLFKRLSSYSREHLLYKALKEFGKIIKTIFLLQYIDDVDLRKEIQKMLNRIESSNKLGKAVFHGSNKEFKYAGKNDQLVADGCKRLIENCIICWNYAYLTQLIFDEKSDYQKELLIKVIGHKSVVSWEHINLSGMYDFSKNAISNEYNFKKDQLFSVNIQSPEK